MLPIDPHHNYAACGGPSFCRYCAEILTEGPERGCRRRAAEDRVRGFRTAAEQNYVPPDPYAAALERMKKENR